MSLSQLRAKCSSTLLFSATYNGQTCNLCVRAKSLVEILADGGFKAFFSGRRDGWNVFDLITLIRDTKDCKSLESNVDYRFRYELIERNVRVNLKFSLLSILFEDDGFRGEEGRGQLQPEKPIR